MWVARCPRCGHAVRWNPREARAPYRLWVRTRALNLRLGVATTAGQAAGIASIGIGAQFVDQYRTITQFENTPSLLRNEFVFMYLGLGGIAALAAAVSAVFLAPEQRMPIRVFLAWTIGALPVILLLSLLPLSAASEVREDVAEAFSEPNMYARSFALCALVPLASLLLAYPMDALRRLVTREFLRRYRSAVRSNLVLSRNAHT
jgi:uncharacterized BrkB/YihY/UPF0761 family membrane protein